jgi:hypothetical protein
MKSQSFLGCIASLEVITTGQHSSAFDGPFGWRVESALSDGRYAKRPLHMTKRVRNR